MSTTQWLNPQSQSGLQRFWGFVRNHHFLFAFLAAIFLAACSVQYSHTLSPQVDGDEIVALESEKALTDSNYQLGKGIVSALGYQTYLYPKYITFLNTINPLPGYKDWMLFLIVGTTFFFAYLALTMLNFPKWISASVALVALMPRYSHGTEIFGSLTPDEVGGRYIVVPFFWLISAWYVHARTYNKKIWPMFFVLGVISYLHPATIIMFFSLLLAIHACWVLFEKRYIDFVKESFLNFIAFSSGACFLLFEILTRSQDIVSDTTISGVSKTQYLEALLYRSSALYPPEALLWAKHILIITFPFFIAVVYVLWQLRNKDSEELEKYKPVVLFGAFIMAFATVIAFVLPSLELWFIRNYDFPLIFWQFLRTYKFIYIGLFLFYAVMLYFVHTKHKNNWLTGGLILVGIFSSTFMFEWAQYVLGYHGYVREYIPVALHDDPPQADEYIEYDELCTAFRAVGVMETEKVLIDDFSIRHFCNIQPHITGEEGTGYIFLGKGPLVWWHQEFLRQKSVLQGESLESLKDYVVETSVVAIVIPTESPVAENLSGTDAKMIQVGDSLVVNVRYMHEDVE